MNDCLQRVTLLAGFVAMSILGLFLLIQFDHPLMQAIGTGISTFLDGLWHAVIVVFWVIVVLGTLIVAAFAFVKIKQMNATHVIYDPKDNRPVRAVIHKGQLVQIAPTGVDLLEIMKIQQQQAVHMQQHWKMIGTATTSMKKFMDEYDVEDDVVDADSDELPQAQAPLRPALPEARGVPYTQERLLVNALEAFQIQADVLSEVTAVGPRIIQFGVVPTGIPIRLADGSAKRDNTGQIMYSKRTRIEEITKREKDLQLALGAETIRILSPVPGKHYVGIEIPNPEPITVTLADILQSAEYQQAVASSKLVFALGRDVTGRVRFCDIEKAPHILIGGTTNAGKSVLLNVLITSLLNNATPDEVRLLLVDPKMVELVPYNGIAHLLREVITDMTKVVPMLKYAVDEMERRYQIFAGLGVRKLAEYRMLRLHRQGLENLPAIVIIIDEFAELMMTTPAETEEKVIRLAQKARATGIHLIIATQKPLVEVVTSLIKGNLPTKIALKTANGSDSRVILDSVGAEELLGNGDMLYHAADSNELVRIQGAYMTNEDIQSVIARALDGESSGKKIISLPSRIANQGKGGTAHPLSPTAQNGIDQPGESGSKAGPNQMETRSGNQMEAAPQGLRASVDGESWEIEQVERKIEQILVMLDATQDDQYKVIWQVVPGKGEKYRKARAERAVIYRYIKGSLRGQGEDPTSQQAEEG